MNSGARHLKSLQPGYRRGLKGRHQAEKRNRVETLQLLDEIVSMSPTSKWADRARVIRRFMMEENP